MPTFHLIWIQGGLYESAPFLQPIHEEMMQRMGPDWSLRIWSGPEIEELLVEHQPSLLAFYQRTPILAQKSDIGRIVILHNLGGVYLDVTVVVKSKPSFELLWQSTLEGQIRFPIHAKPYNSDFMNFILHGTRQPLYTILNNDIILSPPAHPLLTHYMEHMLAYQHKPLLQSESLWVLKSTGPFAATQLLSQHGGGSPFYAKDTFLDIETQPSNRQSWSVFISNPKFTMWASDNISCTVLFLLVLTLTFATLFLVYFVKYRRHQVVTHQSKSMRKG